LNRSNSPTDTAVETDVARIVEDRLARISRIILTLALVVGLFVIAVNFADEGRVSPATWMVASAIPILIVLLGLAVRGRTKAAVQGLIGVIYLVVIGVVIARGTVRVPASSLITLADPPLSFQRAINPGPPFEPCSL